MADRRPPRFAVIKGQGMSRASHPPDLFVLPPMRHREDQLTFFGHWTNEGIPKRILSVGFDALDYEGFRYLLSTSGVRYVIDTRLLASFRSKGFASDLVANMFDNLGVTYFRPYELANQFLASSSDSRLVLRNFVEHLKSTCHESIRQIGHLLTQGSVLVLGHDSKHFGSEREYLIECLAELHRPVEVVVLSSCRGNTISASSYVVGATTAAQSIGHPKGKKRRRPPSRSQDASSDLPSRRNR